MVFDVSAPNDFAHISTALCPHTACAGYICDPSLNRPFRSRIGNRVAITISHPRSRMQLGLSFKVRVPLPPIAPPARLNCSPHTPCAGNPDDTLTKARLQYGV